MVVELFWQRAADGHTDLVVIHNAELAMGLGGTRVLLAELPGRSEGRDGQQPGRLYPIQNRGPRTLHRAGIVSTEWQPGYVPGW